MVMLRASSASVLNRVSTRVEPLSKSTTFHNDHSHLSGFSLELLPRPFADTNTTAARTTLGDANVFMLPHLLLIKILEATLQMSTPNWCSSELKVERTGGLHSLYDCQTFTTTLLKKYSFTQGVLFQLGLLSWRFSPVAIAQQSSILDPSNLFTSHLFPRGSYAPSGTWDQFEVDSNAVPGGGGRVWGSPRRADELLPPLIQAYPELHLYAADVDASLNNNTRLGPSLNREYSFGVPVKVARAASNQSSAALSANICSTTQYIAHSHAFLRTRPRGATYWRPTHDNTASLTLHPSARSTLITNLRQPA
ncbi:hypothetical protein C8R46DRAFT_1210725 [Mycena filopes]|nr:hypothetical protein C8R46DRAFT_1210725 [Mycena filopes]